MIYIDPTPHPYFHNLAFVVQDSLKEPSQVSRDYDQPGTWILNYVSFKNGVKVNGPYIALQTEQMDEKGSKEYRAWLAGAVGVWDWADNYFFGYSPVYRLQMEEAKDIPVLFYGEMNIRRAEVLTETRNAIKDCRGCIEVVHGEYGPGIMKYVMRSKIVLSTHYYSRTDNDMPRIAPLLSVNAFVICEKTDDPKFNALSDHLVIVEKEAIPKTVAYYLDRPLERLAWADKGTAWIKQHPHGLKS